LTWTVVYTRTANEAIRHLDPSIREKVRLAVSQLADDPLRGKALTFSLKGLRSWRTGDWRIVYKTEQHRVTVIVVTVGHRRDVYEKVSRLLGSEG
jgi:mRNA interferase RelE/StbE